MELQYIQSDSLFLLPVFFLVIGALVLFVLDLVKQQSASVYLFLSYVVLGIELVLLGKQLLTIPAGGKYLYHELLFVNREAIFIQLLLSAATLLSFVFIHTASLKRKDYHFPIELFFALFMLLVGSVFMAISNHFLPVFVALEIMSIAAYFLLFFRKAKENREAALKYILFGLSATAGFLYGVSLLYGYTHTLYFDADTFQHILKANQEISWLGGFAVLAILCGFLFKIGWVPFHFWLPDVYETAPTAIVAFLSVVPKVATIYLFHKWLSYTAVISSGPGFTWETILSIISIASIAWGTLAALAQQNSKRLMGYSSIAQAGFFLMALVAFSNEGTIAFYYYALVYTFMNLGAFYVIEKLSFYTQNERIDSYAGLGRIMPYVGVMMTWFMIALTGLPPTAGFTGKIMIFSSIWNEGALTNPLRIALLLTGLGATVVSLFVYLKIPFALFFKSKPVGNPHHPLSISQHLYLLVLALPLFLLLLKWDWVINWLTLLLE